MMNEKFRSISITINKRTMDKFEVPNLLIKYYIFVISSFIRMKTISFWYNKHQNKSFFYDNNFIKRNGCRIMQIKPQITKFPRNTFHNLYLLQHSFGSKSYPISHISCAEFIAFRNLLFFHSYTSVKVFDFSSKPICFECSAYKLEVKEEDRKQLLLF